MIRFGRKSDPHALAVGMTGVKMGDRVVFIGCTDGARLAAIASKVGLSGHAVAVVGDTPAADRARKGASEGGVLVEVEIAPATTLPLENDSFDLAVVDDTANMIAEVGADRWIDTAREVLRILRPGGRILVIGAGPRAGLGGLLSRSTGPGFDLLPGLQSNGYRAVRMLAEREGLRFVEGVKPRPDPV